MAWSVIARVASVLGAAALLAACGSDAEPDGGNAERDRQTELGIQSLDDLAGALQSVTSGDEVVPFKDLRSLAAETAVSGTGIIVNVTEGPAREFLANGEPDLDPYLAIEIEADNLVKGKDIVGYQPIRLIYHWSPAFTIEPSKIAPLGESGRIVFFLAPAAPNFDEVNYDLVGPFSSVEERKTLYWAHPAATLVAPAGSDTAFPLMSGEPPAETKDNMAMLEESGFPVSRFTIVKPDIETLIDTSTEDEKELGDNSSEYVE